MKRFWPFHSSRAGGELREDEITDMQETEASHPSAEPEKAVAQPAEAATPSVRNAVIAQLKTVYDPEIPVNIYELGLIYAVDVDPDGATRITMTLTTPMCPAAEELPPEVETKARGVEGVTSVALDLVWDPPWSPEMMSEAAKLDLGML